MNVVKQRVHAFLGTPGPDHEDQFVLLSKNREDCGRSEKQVQYVTKVRAVREATKQELEALFPGVRAGERFRYVVVLYPKPWVRKLVHPFDLSAVLGFNEKRYRTVQHFAQLQSDDQRAMLAYLQRTNAEMLLDFLNRADPDDHA